MKLPQIQVSENQRFLMMEDGKPFFWMADTAWELMHRGTKEQIKDYLENRRKKGFNVIQTVVLAEEDGLHTPDMAGELPLIDDDPMRPNEAYFDMVDFTIETAAEKGLYVALLPTWGDKVIPMWGGGPQVFTVENAEFFGHWVAERYQDCTNIVWVLGGDRPILSENGDFRAVWQAMATGIRSVLGDKALLTYHPNADPVLEHGAATVHAQEWADFVMFQSSHYAADIPTWEKADTLYRLDPAKPVLDGEINYEDHPIAYYPKWDPKSGYFRDYEVRKAMYRSVFAGGCGVTYGHHHVWQMWDYGREVKNNGFELRPWVDALDRPGAFQVRHLVNLMLSHDFFNRIPDQTMILSEVGEAGSHICATRDTGGTYAMVYIPNAEQTVKLDVSSLQKPYEVNWFDPRTGYTHPIEGQLDGDTLSMTTPLNGPDWVLLIEKV